jgi:CRP-like cAMP-binding protein
MFDTLASIPAVLAQADIFYELTPDQLELITSISVIREYGAEDLIFEENSASQELYVILDGQVDIQVDPSTVGESSRLGPLTLTTFRRGQSFGEMALIDMGLRSASARSAQDETHLVVIPVPT